MSRAIILFGFVFTTTHQGTGAPVVDGCGGQTREKQRWSGYAIHLTPWRRNQYGDRLDGMALCIGRLA